MGGGGVDSGGNGGCGHELLCGELGMGHRSLGNKRQQDVVSCLVTVEIFFFPKAEFE